MFRPATAENPPTPRRGRKKGAPFPERRFTANETATVEALYLLGLHDAVIALFLRRIEGGIVQKRLRMGLFRFVDEIRSNPRPTFRLDAAAVECLQMLEPVDSRLWKCFDAFPQFITNYVDDLRRSNKSFVHEER